MSSAAPSRWTDAPRRALLVSTSSFKDERFRELRAPGGDAAALAGVLGDPEIGAFDVSVSRDEPRSRLRARLTRFFEESEPDDLLLLYVATHGVRSPDGSLFFAVTDSALGAFEETAIAASAVSELLSRSSARSIVVVLDCCFSGAFPAGLQARSAAPGLGPAEALSGPGRAVLASSSELEYSFEGDSVHGDGVRSIFTTAIVDGLATGDADLDEDGLIDVDELYRFVVDRVRQATPHQTPTLFRSDLNVPIYVARNAALPLAVEAPAAPEAVVRRPSLSMLADVPIATDEDDRLGFGGFADAIAELIDNPRTYTPLSLAISAPWGTGKTSLARLVEHRLALWPILRGEHPHAVCWFDAWLHDDAPHLGAAFAADVAKQAGAKRNVFVRLTHPLPVAMLSPGERWRRRILVAGLAMVAAVLATLIPGVRGLFTEAGVPKHSGSFGASFAALLAFFGIAYAIWSKLYAFAQAAAGFIDDPRSEAARGEMAQVRSQLGRIITQGTPKRSKFVIFVDNLERCRPPRAVEVCEVASQLLGHPGVVTVLIADMNAIAAAAAIKYAELEGKYVADLDYLEHPDQLLATYGRAYLEKLVQIQFDLPPAPRELLKAMLAT